MEDYEINFNTAETHFRLGPGQISHYLASLVRIKRLLRPRQFKELQTTGKKLFVHNISSEL